MVVMLMAGLYRLLLVLHAACDSSPNARGAIPAAGACRSRLLA